jgi:hypothetical protein
MYMDFTATQSIKFYNKGVEKLPGEAFNGKLLLTWLIQVQDKANMFTWTSILTINGKPLTQNFTKITMEEVRAHAQVYQDRSLREAQNSEMLIQCLKASITRTVYNKIYLQREKYIILRKNTMEQVEFGICFLKTIIDNYHSKTRSSAKQIRKQLATLNHYMRNVAKGDVSKLCEHTRELMFELNAADETTNDLLANLIEALREAPDSNFQRWLSNQVDLWSMRKLDWKQIRNWIRDYFTAVYILTYIMIQGLYHGMMSTKAWIYHRYINKHTRQKSLKKYLKSWRSRLARLNEMFDTYIKENYKVLDYQIKIPSMREHDLTWRPYGYYRRRRVMAARRRCIA